MKLETTCLHGGTAPDPTTTARAIPVSRTTSFQFNNTEHAANLFALKELGNIYTRLTNPTADALEQRVALMEGGAAALALASGTSAIFYSIINIASQGDHVVAANNLYGGTYTMFNDILPQFGITTTFVDPADPKNFGTAITDSTKAVFCETIGNPGLNVSDIEAIATIAHDNGLPLIVDSTFTTPYLLNPIQYGADIVIHSLTKWMGGHGTGIGGIVVDAGTFDWSSRKFPLMSEPETSYGGVRWAIDLPEMLAPVAYLIRMRTIPLRNLGACIAPDNAWQFMQGIETLPLRMERHCENANAGAEHLSAHASVEWVRYPGLDGDQKDVVEKYLPKGRGAMVVFGIKGGAEAGQKFIDSLKLFSHVANVGDAKSLAIHPATTTHSQLSEEQQIAGGIAPELVRLSVGIEHIDDILGDLDQALANS